MQGFHNGIKNGECKINFFPYHFPFCLCSNVCYLFEHKLVKLNINYFVVVKFFFFFTPAKTVKEEILNENQIRN